ncbi:endoplasmic reticulum-type [Listeria monocytogenes N53-1]|nr:endoplasmic reticulum-type [Listeria monocytogenes N53-1]
MLNMVLGIYQENSAEKALAALQSMNAHLTTVVRDGVRMQVDATELVPGDIIEIVAGDMIPADARIISSSSLQVEESALTGESVPVEKDANAVISEKAPIGDRLNMLYSGCLVTNGLS